MMGTMALLSFFFLLLPFQQPLIQGGRFCEGRIETKVAPQRVGGGRRCKWRRQGVNSHRERESGKEERTEVRLGDGVFLLCGRIPFLCVPSPETAARG